MRAAVALALAMTRAAAALEMRPRPLLTALVTLVCAAKEFRLLRYRFQLEPPELQLTQPKRGGRLWRFQVLAPSEDVTADKSTPTPTTQP